MDRAIHAASTQEAGISGIHDRVRGFLGNVSYHQFQDTIPAATVMRVAFHAHLSVSASTPGSFLPSRNSSDAPPPVEICVILSATLAACTAATESPPPTIEIAPAFSATACAILKVPRENPGTSNTPIGPFHTMV